MTSLSGVSPQATSIPPTTIEIPGPIKKSIAYQGSLESNVIKKLKCHSILFSSGRVENEKLEQEGQFRSKRLKSTLTNIQDPMFSPFNSPLSWKSSPLEQDVRSSSLERLNSTPTNNRDLLRPPFNSPLSWKPSPLEQDVRSSSLERLNSTPTNNRDLLRPPFNSPLSWKSSPLEQDVRSSSLERLNSTPTNNQDFLRPPFNSPLSWKSSPLEQDVRSSSLERLNSTPTNNRDLLCPPFNAPLGQEPSLERSCYACTKVNSALNLGDLFRNCNREDALTQAIQAYSNGIEYLSSNGIEHLSKAEPNSVYNESLYLNLTLRLANTYMARANTLNAGINDKKLAFFYYQEYLTHEGILKLCYRQTQNPHMIEALKHLLAERPPDNTNFAT